MSDIAIRVDNLSKAYRIGLKEQQHETLLGAMGAFIRAPFRNFRDLRKLSRFDEAPRSPRVMEDGRSKMGDGPETAQLPTANCQLPTGNTHLPNGDGPNSQLPTPNSQPQDVLWALKNVSFEVKHGEAVGIIGRNGAGKSTLLKILSRITEPTSGRAEIFGRVGSLLEVGTGFHPDLTGRENTYLNGTILGMKKREIDSRFDEIVAFSGVEKFIDTPVKRYSSGMRVRLAFSVAAHLNPEILIVDEVLSVGDADFQKRCLGKMEDVASCGRTVIFVSHNMLALKSLCKRGILLRDGELAADGEICNAVDAYLQTDAREVLSQEWTIPTTLPGTDSYRLNSVRLRSADRSPDGRLTVQSEFEVEVSLRAARAGRINLTLHLYLLTGEVVFAVVSPVVHVAPGNHRFICHFPSNLLNDAPYTLGVMIVEDYSRAHLTMKDVIRFEVHDVTRDGSWFGRWPGFVRPRMQWDYEEFSDNGKS